MTSPSSPLRLYAKAVSRGGYGAAHLARRTDPSWTRCDLSTKSMQLLLDGAATEICARCASTCSLTDAAAFLDGIADSTIHAIVTDCFEGALPPLGHLQPRHVDGFARVLRPGGHVFALRAWYSPGYYAEFGAAGFEFRGSIVRVFSPKKKPKKTDDVARTTEFFDLYRKQFDGTVAQCLRLHQTGGLRRASAERPFCDVIHTDDRDDFLEQLRRASLPLGVGTIVDPFMLRRWRVGGDK